MKIKNFIVGPLLTNCYLLISNSEAIVIDPGAGLKVILKVLENKKLNYIILTHHHWDHTLGALKLKEKTGAKILIHKAEKDFIKFKPDKFLDDGEEIILESPEVEKQGGRRPTARNRRCLERGSGDYFGEYSLKVIHTPGHTKGGICLLGGGFIFTGDTLFEDGTGRTDLPGGSQKDLENSLKKLEKVIKPGMKIYPGHGPIFEKP